MAEGLLFDMWPRYCQDGGALGSGQLKCTGKIENKYEKLLCDYRVRNITSCSHALGQGNGSCEEDDDVVDQIRVRDV